MLDELDRVLNLAAPDRDSFGVTEQAERGATSAEGFYGDARGRQRRDGLPFRRADAEKVRQAQRARTPGSGNPMEHGILQAMTAAIVARARANPPV